MSDFEDEFDQFNKSLDVDHLPYITDLPPSPEVASNHHERQFHSLRSSQAEVDPILSSDPKSSPRSEYSAYDLSEFTSEELQALESAALETTDRSSGFSIRCQTTTASKSSQHHHVLPRTTSLGASESTQTEKGGKVTIPDISPQPRCSTLPNTLSNGGPAINIELEQSSSSPNSTNVSGILYQLLYESFNEVGKGKENSGVTDMGESMGSTSDSEVTRSAIRKGRERAIDSPEPTVVVIEPRKPKIKSWRRMMKKGAWFRVTDFTGPMWCEVQFGYQHLHEEQVKEDRKEEKEERHAIVTPEGKTIKVHKPAIEKQAKIKQTGTSIHRVLELEAHPEEERVVQIETKEDRLGIYFIRMINSVESLIENGVCREMVVLGFVHDELVRGVIDEVVREPLPPPSLSPSDNDRKRGRGDTSLPTTPKKPRKPPKMSKNQSPSQTPITSFFPNSPTPRPIFPPIAEPHFRLRISDTKTRMYPYVPPSQDTTSGRLQLMIYHRLLSSLLAPKSSPFATDFAGMWKKAGVSPTAKFSPKFHEGTELPFVVSCLQDLVNMWYTSVEMLSARTVNPELTIEWRTLDTSSREEVTVPEETVVSADSTGLEVPLQEPEAAADVEGDLVEDVAATDARNSPTAATMQDTKSKGTETEEDLRQYRSIVIGTTTFLQEDDILDSHLSDILELWNGKRQPRGVDISLTRRCNSCAFRYGCEWREQKSAEALKHAQGVLQNDPFASSVPGLGLPSYAAQSATSTSASSTSTL